MTKAFKDAISYYLNFIRRKGGRKHMVRMSEFEDRLDENAYWKEKEMDKWECSNCLEWFDESIPKGGACKDGWLCEECAKKNEERRKKREEEEKQQAMSSLGNVYVKLGQYLAQEAQKTQKELEEKVKDLKDNTKELEKDDKEYSIDDIKEVHCNYADFNHEDIDFDDDDDDWDDDDYWDRMEQEEMMEDARQDELDSYSSPSYYNKFEHSPIQIMRERMTDEQFEGLLWGWAMKYIMRYGKKDPKIKDVSKAIQVLSWLQEGLEDDDTFKSNKITLP